MICRQLQGIADLLFFFFLELELKTPMVMLILEETVQNNLLIFFDYSIFAFYEGRKKP